MIYRKNNSINVFATGFLYLIILLIIFVLLHIQDYKKCSQRANFFNLKIKKHSFLKRKCRTESKRKDFDLNSLDN